MRTPELSIGQMAQRTGLAVSAIRFYETEGLISANRNRVGHRRFARAQVRRVSFILIAQKFG
jgi:MerR family redox-sensitive transcriptional activator SoxR